MKIHMKTIGSEYDEQTGLSTVTLATDLGLFDGFAQLHPDDKEIASHYAGCRYAEMRAGIKYMKAKVRVAKYKLEPLYKIYNELKQQKSYDENNKGIKLLQKEIYILEDEIKTFTNHVETLTTRLNEAIKNRPELVEKMVNKKQDNE